MLRADLAAAEIEPEDDAGHVLDYHALRHTYISLLVESGAHPAVVKVLARHSTITLTMDRYAHVGAFNMRSAVDSLPDLGDAGQRQRMRVTGTESAVAPLIDTETGPKKGTVNGTVTPCFSGHERALPCTQDAITGSAATSMKSRERQDPSGLKDGTPGRTRTCDLRIRNPLLYPAELRARI